jgi:hypothetical protein
MNAIPIEYGLILAGILFMLGMVSVLIRRNIIFMRVHRSGVKMDSGRRPDHVHFHPYHGGS